MEFLREFSQLIFPSRCFGCSNLSPTICAECSINWQPNYFKTQMSNFNVYSSIIYSPIASKIILAAKENGIAAADELLINCIVSMVDKVTTNRDMYRLVPIPSSKQSIRRRGRSFMVDLTQEVARRTGFTTLDCLALTSQVSDQSGLTKSQRLINMHGAFSSTRITRGKLIIIDDVITTGATLKEAVRAINFGEFHAQISAITACVAQPLRWETRK